METSEVMIGVDIGPRLKHMEDLSGVAKVAMEIERLGFDSVWIPDHEVDPLATLSFIAGNTGKVRLGTCVLIPDHRHPVLLAREIATLDQLSRGRFVLGLGAGEDKEIFGMQLDRPVGRMLETIKILTELWNSTEVTYDGDFWKLRNYALELKPVQKPHPPIWLAAAGPRMLDLTAKHGDGCIGPQLNPDRYRKWLSRLHGIAKKAGRNPAEIIPVHLPFTSISRDHDSAVKWLEPHAKWFLLWASQPPSLLIQELGYEGRWERVEDVPREAVEKSFIVGTPEECAGTMIEFIRSGARYFILAIRSPDEDSYFESLRLYAEEVMPRVRAAIG